LDSAATTKIRSQHVLCQVRRVPAPARPDFQAELDHIVNAIVERTKTSKDHEPGGRAVRSAHAKTYGLLRATVTVLPDVPAEYAQGIYATPATYEAVVRYSNGLGHIRPDAYLGPACGMGIKIIGVPGASLLDDEPDAITFDYNLINNPTFFCNTVHDYTYIEPLFSALPEVLATEQSRRQWMHDFLTNAGTLPPEKWLWDELLSILSFTSIAPRNLLSYSYWSMGAVRHGDYIAKVRTAPLTEGSHDDVDVHAEPEAHRNKLTVEAGERDHRFALQVQLSTGLAAMPVDNTSVEWPEKASPFVTVAHIDIPRQDISGEENLAIADSTSITPWRARAEHAPLGEIMEVRREVYRQSSITRHQVNGQERREPTSLADLFG
jgi:hypothetical protein